ncbi:MAG: hypothetical protein ACXWAT_10860 [Methylobacter sp.]
MQNRIEKSVEHDYTAGYWPKTMPNNLLLNKKPSITQPWVNGILLR